MARFETADVQAALDALRSGGAAERNPVRFAYLEALARRAAVQPEAVRQVLNGKLNAKAHELAAPATAPSIEASVECAASPLSALLAYISPFAYEQPETTPSTRNTAPLCHAQPAPELRSIACFHETWSRLSTEQQLAETLACAPENAGPLNSQHLVLRSLQLMRDIAPDYLQGFMSYIDTLVWLEQTSPAKPASGRLSGVERETAGLKQSSSRRKPVR